MISAVLIDDAPAVVITRRCSSKSKKASSNIPRARVFVTKKTTPVLKTTTPVRISRLYEVRSSCFNVQTGCSGIIIRRLTQIFADDILKICANRRVSADKSRHCAAAEETLRCGGRNTALRRKKHCAAAEETLRCGGSPASRDGCMVKW